MRGIRPHGDGIERIDGVAVRIRGVLDAYSVVRPAVELDRDVEAANNLRLLSGDLRVGIDVDVSMCRCEIRRIETD